MKYFFQAGIGICIGTLLGLSVSNTLEVVLTAIMTLIITMTSILSGISANDQTSEKSNLIILIASKINIAFIFTLTIGITLGSFLGIFMRTHNVLGNDLKDDIEKWRITGLKDDQIALRIFKNEYPLDSSIKITSLPPKLDEKNKTSLFGNDGTICKVITNFKGKELRSQLLQLGDNRIDSIINANKNDTILIDELKKVYECY